MKIDTLQAKVDNNKKKIDKVLKTLERHNSRLEKIKNELNYYDIDLNNYDKYNYRNSDVVWELIFAYESKLEDVKNNEKKLKQLNIDLEKSINSLEVEKKKKDDINNVIPQCLLDFLERWKNKAKDYYINLANGYIELKLKEHEVTEEILKKLYVMQTDCKTWKREKVRRYTDEEINDILNNNYRSEEAKIYIKEYYLKQFMEKHFKAEMYIINKIVSYNNIKFEVLEKILNDDIEIKKENFIERIREVVGVIEDLNGLSIGSTGEIGGIVKGKKCSAIVQTIGAGGYNIQCFHYRVLVNKIKQ